MLLAPESHIKQRFKWKACFWLSGHRRPQREEPWRRTWDNTSSPGSELCTELKRPDCVVFSPLLDYQPYFLDTR
ncbi:hypothetical protein INR49_013812 [Caranx melampygus]|nr:hypothetical protein INR49_013812 [Caranx melampygus]